MERADLIWPSWRRGASTTHGWMGQGWPGCHSGGRTALRQWFHLSHAPRGGEKYGFAAMPLAGRGACRNPAEAEIAPSAPRHTKCTEPNLERLEAGSVLAMLRSLAPERRLEGRDACRGIPADDVTQQAGGSEALRDWRFSLQIVANRRLVFDRVWARTRSMQRVYEHAPHCATN